MSDLSLPPLSLVPVRPLQPRQAAAVAAQPQVPVGGSEPFAWPTPPYATFPSPRCQVVPEPCQIEGPNGNVTSGRLAFFDAEAGIAHLQVPPARGTITLKVAQVRRITLLRPLAPLESPAPGSAAELLGHAPVSECRLRFANGHATQLDSIGHVEHALGHFLFPPFGEHGQVLRSFYPRTALTAITIGPRVGELLVAQRAATEDEVDHVAAEQLSLRQRRLGDILLTQRIVAPEQLLEAIEQQSKMPMVRIGEALIALGFIDERQLGDALQQQTHDRNVPLGELLVQSGVVTREDLQTALARKMGYPVVDAGEFPVEPDAALRLPQAVARRLPALPLMMRGGRLVVALEDPSARILIDEIEFNAQAKVVPVLARAGTLAAAIDRVYQRLGHDAVQPSAELSSAVFEPEPDSANRLLANLELQLAGERRDDAPAIEQSDNSLVRLINSMILEAQQGGVSDIHIECAPGNEKVRIRFRRDGRLKPYLELPPSYRAALVARLKIMCDLDISERRKPQDGKISFGRFVQGQTLELRVATIPTANNLEDVVLRLLSSARALPLDDMGMAPDVLQRLKAVVERPYGLVLCVGPTGSGKTTTLHAALGHINTPERKIWTAEDPVEITQRGLRQVQVNPRIDWTFAKALRAFLRADPDVVMVGEIRDPETAQMAVEASLTGHLVMSTLHTNSATETVTRLLDMGIDPFSFADSLLAVLAQRLVRRLCRHCTVARPATAEEIEALLDDWLAGFAEASQRPEREATLAGWVGQHGRNGQLLHHHGRGCKQCMDTGFSGRLGLHELMVVNRDLRRLIQTHARNDQLQQAAMDEGLRTLRQDGIAKVLAGLTTIEEVRATSNA
ncbi:GspE/PulE family protein [Aquabacterium sp.]|uniref:GspE/PulE family protein n=1 Tax=Aquabacterium sp. TaxID=1872578 RepID=UPI002BE2946E|nr:ATPase, T2SS/T4P/T4SS family [Aquabacterium sp.]HSW06195.1 ATPase, T2SS/T4P/T4SS family [Aquabacterium sp.]